MHDGDRPDAESVSPPDRRWPPLRQPEPRPGSRVPPAATDGFAASTQPEPWIEEIDFCEREPPGRWPALADLPSTQDEDWPAMRRRMDRIERLDREQRGW
jgi:hypothetical protein